MNGDPLYRRNAETDNGECGEIGECVQTGMGRERRRRPGWLWICIGARSNSERLRQAVGATVWTSNCNAGKSPRSRGYVNQERVKEGWCWWYRKYTPGETVLEGLEKAARETKKGLWADPQPVPPWEWRRLRQSRWSFNGLAEGEQAAAYFFALHSKRFGLL